MSLSGWGQRASALWLSATLVGCGVGTISAAGADAVSGGASGGGGSAGSGANGGAGGGASGGAAGGASAGGGGATQGTNDESCGACDQGQCVNGSCLCDWGFAGAACDTCANGHSGPDCHAASTATAPEASVTSGVAPLGVFFDGSLIANVAEGDFLNASFDWQFGDAGGLYGTTNLPRNRATGFVTGHVFETPGTYEVRLGIVDVAGTTLQADTVTITVSEFQGETRCLSNGGNFDAAPAGCVEQTSGDLASQLRWVDGAPNRRLLLRRGDTWSLNESVRLTGDGPSIVGAFGPASDAQPLVNCNGVSEAINAHGDGFRLMDIEFANGGLNFAGKQQVILRVNQHGSGHVGIGIGGHEVFMADSTSLDNSYFSVYADGSRMSMVGSEIDQMRVATSFLGVPTDSRDVYVAHNVIDASRPEPTTGIKWHSRRGVIADNILTAGLSRIAITTDSGDVLTAVDEDLGIVLVERNLMRLSFGGAKPQNDAYSDAGVSFNTSHHVVLRHNLLCDIPRAFADSARGAEPPAQHVSIYNNSITKTKVAGLNGDEGDFLALQSVPDDWHVFNNVVDVADGRSAMLVRIANHLSMSGTALSSNSTTICAPFTVTAISCLRSGLSVSMIRRQSLTFKVKLSDPKQLRSKGAVRTESAPIP